MINPFAVILPSAGLGTRFGKEIPKQYQKIQGKLVINYSLELFLTFKECKKIVIAISNLDDFHHPLLKDSRIEIIQGGNSRADSVRRCFDKLVSIDSQEDVLIHDSARPCIQLEDLTNFLEIFSSSQYAGMIFANPCTDTLKSSKNGEIITGTEDRSFLWQAQTPQIFRFKNLYNGYNSYSGEINQLTDESAIFDKLKDEIALYKNSSNNIKITHSDDLQLAEYLLKNIKK